MQFIMFYFIMFCMNTLWCYADHYTLSHIWCLFGKIWIYATLCHLVAFNHFMPAGLCHGLNRGINREWHKMPTLVLDPINRALCLPIKTSQLRPRLKPSSHFKIGRRIDSVANWHLAPSDCLPYTTVPYAIGHKGSFTADAGYRVNITDYRSECQCDQLLNVTGGFAENL